MNVARKLNYETVSIDETSLSIVCGGKHTLLRRREWQLFHALWTHLGQTVSKDALNAMLLTTGAGDVGEDILLRVHLYNLRHRITKLPLRIDTIRAKGYRLVMDEEGS